MAKRTLDAQTILNLRTEAIENASVGIAILSPREDDYRLLDVNDSFARIMGYAADELVGQPLTVLSGPRTDYSVMKDAVESAYCLSPHSGSLIAYRQDLQPQPLDFTSSSHCDEQGNIQHVLITIRDATGSMRDRDARTLSNTMSSAFREASTPADIPGTFAEVMVPHFADWCTIHLQNDDGTFQLAAIANRLGEEPAGAIDTDIKSEGIGAVAASGIPLIHQPSEPCNPTLAAQMSAILGKPVYSILTVPIAADPTHSLGALSWVVTDDHREYLPADREVAEEAAAKLGHFLHGLRVQDSLSNALLARERFLSVAGHELRTPVVSIKGYTQLLLRDLRRREISRERIESGLRTIEASTSRLTALTEDIFTVYNAGYSSVPLTLKSVPLQTYLVEFFANTQKHLLHGHTIDLDGITAHAWVRIDVVRFAQVLYNLVNNAERFSRPDIPIQVETSLSDGGVVISVRDGGKGLAAGEEEEIFNLFASTRPHTMYAQQGLGISLHITRKIVERHQGRIWAESPGSDEGTTFHIYLPTVSEPTD